MKIKKLFPMMVCASLVFAGCAKTADSTATTTNANGSTSSQEYNTNETTTAQEVTPSDAEENRVEITGDFVIDTQVEGGYSVSGTTYTFTKGGEYVLSGALHGNIIIDIGDDEEIEIMLNNAGIYCSDSAPIYAANAKKVVISAKGTTFNEVVDERAAASDTDDATDKDASALKSQTARAAIYSKVDMELKGQGSLVVSAGYNNGIQSKKDLNVKNITLKVTAVGNCIKGNDSLSIESGEITVVSSDGDGLKTSNSDESGKGKQRGTLTISGGNIAIYSSGDGISAAYDAVISGEGNVSIHTDTYSQTGQNSQGSSGELYVIVPSKSYNSSNDYYVYFYNESGDEKWVKAEFASMVSGGGSSYYGLSLSVPSGYTSAKYYVINGGATPSDDNAVACSGGDTINTSMNGFLFTSVSGSSISGDYVSLTTSGGNKTSTKSSKGIKAGNSINISGATVTIETGDDGLHADTGSLDTGSTGSGKVYISGGSVTITAADDGVHADTDVEISGGYVNVLKSYEGIEGCSVSISGGNVYVYATDDGINASNSGTSTGGMNGIEDASVLVSGGYVDVTTASGDTDGIDSNGDYVQTGGFVIVKGGASSGNVAGSVDVNGSIKISGGAIVALGGICELPEDSVNAYSLGGTSFDAGDYVLTDADGNEILKFSLSATYTNGWIASEGLTTGKTFTLTKGDTQVASWTQTEGTMGTSGSGGFPGGGGGFPGGGPGGGRR